MAGSLILIGVLFGGGAALAWFAISRIVRMARRWSKLEPAQRSRAMFALGGFILLAGLGLFPYGCTAWFALFAHFGR